MGALLRFPESIHSDRKDEDFVVQRDLGREIDNCITCWNAANTAVPVLHETYSARNQGENEHILDNLESSLRKEISEFPESANERATGRRRMLREVKGAAARVLGYPAKMLRIIFSDEYVDVTKSFVREAKAFDPDFGLESLGQALRNVWVMNWIQLFLGGKPSLSPSIFAYSMLYPCTDNYLDLAGISANEKSQFNQALGRRLMGMDIRPGSARERDVFHLIGMIERQYPREVFKEIYQGLLAIHHGQVQSLLQQDGSRQLTQDEILLISVEKGGASVLADALLIAGRLGVSHASFFFGLGVLLQFLDDLQDLQPDLDAGRRTLFSGEVRMGKLDDLTNRLHHFMQHILTAGKVGSPCAPVNLLRELLGKNCHLLLLRSIAINSDFYSEAYIRLMEGYSPCRFSYLRERGAKPEDHIGSIQAFMSCNKNLRSIVDLLD